MNKQEAIKYLEQHKYSNTCGQKSLEESNEAIDMAIEALVLHDKHSKAVERMIEGAKEINIFLERMTSDYKDGDSK